MADTKNNEEVTEKDKPLAATESQVAEALPIAEKDPVKRITLMVLIIAVFVFIWYVMADRDAPWSDQAWVQAYVIPISPQVSGRITDVNVEKNQVVQAGDLLFSIESRDYQLAVDNAETALEIAGQDIGAGVANVVTAQSQLVVAETNLEHIQAQGARVFELEKKEVFSKSEGDKARAAIKQAKAQVRSAVASLDKAKQALGPEGDKNPRIRSAITTLKEAQLALSRTDVLAPSLGGITNLQVDTGFYANAGALVMTFVEFDNIWLQVNLRENNLANLKIGNSVEILLDVHPGKIFNGTISSIGFAVEGDGASQIGGLSSAESKSGWLREAQRFPVIINFDNLADMPKGTLRLGGQADVQIYTGDNWFVNSMGKMWIRVLSWLSYVY